MWLVRRTVFTNMLIALEALSPTSLQNLSNLILSSLSMRAESVACAICISCHILYVICIKYTAKVRYLQSICYGCYKISSSCFFCKEMCRVQSRRQFTVRFPRQRASLISFLRSLPPAACRGGCRVRHEYVRRRGTWDWDVHGN